MSASCCRGRCHPQSYPWLAVFLCLVAGNVGSEVGKRALRRFSITNHVPGSPRPVTLTDAEKLMTGLQLVIVVQHLQPEGCALLVP